MYFLVEFALEYEYGLSLITFSRIDEPLLGYSADKWSVMKVGLRIPFFNVISIG
jgi:hypothetical protein